MLFKRVEGSAIILRSKGVFKQTDVYERNGQLYAKAMGGFIGLRTDPMKQGGNTTHPDILWEHIEGVNFSVGQFGIMHTDARLARAA